MQDKLSDNIDKRRGKESSLFVESQSLAVSQCKQLSKNNSYLLRKCGKNNHQQSKDFDRRYGLSLSPSRLTAMRQGRFKALGLVFLNFFAVYWQIPLKVLLFEDLEAQDKLNTPGPASGSSQPDNNKSGNKNKRLNEW